MIHIRPYLELARPANILTAVADIMAGYAVATYAAGLHGGIMWLVGATIALYGGGIALNDVCDAKKDAHERPERPLPRGALSRKKGLIYALALLATGVLFSFISSPTSGFIALAILACIVIYNTYAKNNLYTAPLFMGLCRAGNLLLGISIVPEALNELWVYAFIPLAYVAGITAISRKELEGKNRQALVYGGLLYIISIVLFIVFILPHALHPVGTFIFLALLAVILFSSLFKAYRTTERTYIMSSVKTAVLLIILFDAAYVVAFSGMYYGLLMIILIPASYVLARYFSVT